MGRRNFSEGQEVLSADLNNIHAIIEKGLYENVLHQLLHKPTTAFFGNGFYCSRTSATTVTVKAGNGIQYDSTQTSPESTRRPLNLVSDSVQTIAAAHASLNRIDIISVKWSLATETSASRNFKDVDDATVTSVSTVVQKKWTCDIVVTTGTAGASPSAPATPTGYTKIADVLVTAVTGVVAQSSITDYRSIIQRGRFNVLWYPMNGLAPTTAEENALLVDLMELSAGQTLSAAVKVPENYIAGYPILVNLEAYSPSSSNKYALQIVTTLIRAGTDALTSTTNQNTSTSGDMTNTVANMLRKIPINLTDISGQINSVAVSPGDILILKLTRSAISSGSDDTADIRVIDGGTEGVF